MSSIIGSQAAPRSVRGHMGLLTAIVLALLGVGLAAHGALAASSAQVHGFLVEGQRALANQDHAQAILAFERARWLAPRASSVRTALASVGAVDPEGAITRAARLLSSQEWSFLATSFAWFATLAAGLALATTAATGGRRALGRAALVAVAGFVLTLGGVMLSNASSPAIVTSASAPLLVAPYAAASSESTLPAGTMVLTDRGYDAYVKVQAPDGQSGWVPRSSLGPIAASGG